jgi:DNA-binding MarR family transcriptional regulator
VNKLNAERARLLSEIEVAMNRVVTNSRRGARTVGERSGVPLAGLTVATLARIRRHGSARLTDIARDLGYEPSRVSKEVQRLVAAGLVEQQRDADDRRVYLLTLTRAGEQTYRRYRQAADRLLAGWMDDWSDRDLAQLARLLTRLADSTTGSDNDSAVRVSRSR